MIAEKQNAHTSGMMGSISSVQFSPDGSKIVSGGIADQTIKVWGAPPAPDWSLTMIAEKQNAHNSGIESVEYNNDGTKIVSAGTKIKVWGLVGWSRKDHLLFNLTTQRFVLLLLWLNKYSMQFPDDVLDLLIQACLQDM